MVRKSLADRYFEKVDIRGPNDCWPWLGYATNNGYGRMKVDGVLKYATHILFYLKHGHYPPKGRISCHHCDNPPCNNPRHLYLGTNRSNMRDKKERRRGNYGKGERARNVKLTSFQVHMIRFLLRSGETQTSIGWKFGVSQSIVSKIGMRQRWAHLPTEHLVLVRSISSTKAK